MSCKLDVKKGILNDVWQNFGEGRATFSRIADDIIQVNSKGLEGGKAKNRKQAFKIAENFLDRTRKRYRSHVNGFISEVDDFTPITINLSVSEGYVDYLYSKLPEGDKNDPAEPRDLSFYNGDFALMEQEERDSSGEYIEEDPRERAIIESLKFADEVPDLHRKQFETDPEAFLKEIAQQANSSESEAEGALKMAGMNLYKLALRLFPEAQTGDPQDVKVTPDKRFQYDQNFLFQMAEIDPEDTPMNFLEKHSENATKIKDALKKANPDVKFVWTQEDPSNFDPIANTITVSLPTLYHRSRITGIPFKQVLEAIITHEISHSISYYALEIPTYRDVIQDLYDTTYAENKNNPFIDHLRNGYNEGGLAYAFKDLDEFLAEADSNPYFQEYLKKIPYKKEGLSVWDKLINFLRGLLGLNPKDSVYDAIINYNNTEEIQEANREYADHSSVGWPEGLLYDASPEIKGKTMDYISAEYEFFTQSIIKKDIEEIFKQITAAIIKIKQKIGKVDRVQAQELQKLIDAYNDTTSNRDTLVTNLNMLTTAIKIAKDINQRLILIDRIEQPDKLLLEAKTLKSAADSLEFIQPLIQDTLTLVRRIGITKGISNFIRDLESTSQIASSVSRVYDQKVRPAVISILVASEEVSPRVQELEEKIKELNKKLESAPTENDRKYYQGLIKRAEENLMQVPSIAVFKEIFGDNYKDASISQLLFESSMANSHPIVNFLANDIYKLQIDISHEILPIRNKAQKALSDLMKAIGVSSIKNSETTYKPITDFVERVDSIEENEDGTLKVTYTKQRAYLSEYEFEYVKQASTHMATVEFYFSKLGEAIRDNNQENITKYDQKLSEAQTNKRDWFKANSEYKYTDEVREMFDLMDKELVKTTTNPDGTTTTVVTNFYKERGHIFDSIQDQEKLRNYELLPEGKAKYQEMIDHLHIQLNQLRSTFDEDGKEKEGFELELSNIANQYYELRNKYGKHILTQDGLDQFELDKLFLDNQLESGSITEEEYNERWNKMTVTELDDTYYQALKLYSRLIGEASETLMSIPELKTYFEGVDPQRIKDGYEKIKDLVRGFRDNDGTIDAILFSKVRPQLISEIKKIQEEIEELKAVAEKLRGLSIRDKIRQTVLHGKAASETITDEERAELDSLNIKKQEIAQIYNNNKQIINEFYELISVMSDLTQSTSSDYYRQEVERQSDIIRKEEAARVLDEIKTSTSLDGGLFTKKGDRWRKKIPGDDENVEIIKANPGQTVEETLADMIAQGRLKGLLLNSEWWKNNHFDKYVYNRKAGQYEVAEVPIYIWVKTSPVNKEFIKPDQPSIKYKTYKIYDGTIEDSEKKKPNYLNPNYKTINDGIAAPKKDLFRNERYDKLKNSEDKVDKAYFKFLEFSRGVAHKADEYHPENKRNHDIMPSLVKSSDEALVNTANMIGKRMGNILRANINIAAKPSQDIGSQQVTGGSTTNYYAVNRVLPIRFANRMSFEEQSSDIPAMILAYAVSAIEFNKMEERQPFYEALRSVVDNLGVTEVKNIAGKFSWTNLFSAAQGKNKTYTVTKETDKSTLSKTIDHILATQIYGETKKSANINIRGMELDLNKLSTGLKKFTSYSIFALNFYTTIKNSTTGSITGFINSRIGEGWYTRRQYLAAKVEAARHVREYVQDFTKFGNKTQIGQELDYFQVFHGTYYNEFGQLTQWTIPKNALSFLTLPKQASEAELQISQYLAMSQANPVKVNGEYVEFRKAFELKDNPDGSKTLGLKEGAEVTKKDIVKFMAKVKWLNENVNGAYKRDERNYLQKHILGDLMFYLNGYLVPGIRNRFSPSRYYRGPDMLVMGYHRQLLQFIGDLVKYRVSIKKRWGDMSEAERSRVVRSLTELSIVVGMALLITFVLGGGDDKEELKTHPSIQNYMLALTIGVKSEIEGFIPLPTMGLNELARKINSPFVALRQVTNILKVLENTYLLVKQSPEAYYKQTGYKDGFHDKGDPKVVANLLRLIGYTGIGFDPVERVLRIRKNQYIR